MGGGVSDCNTHPLLQSDRPTQTVTHPPPKLTSSHHIRDIAFLCVQASIIHGTSVPAPSHASPLPQEVKVR